MKHKCYYTCQLKRLDDVFLQIRVDDRKLQLDYDKKLFLSAISNNNFKLPLDFLDNEISVEYVDFLPNVRDTFISADDGVKTLHLVVPGDDGMQSEYLKNFEQKKIKNNVFSFNNPLEGELKIMFCGNTYFLSYLRDQLLTIRIKITDDCINCGEIEFNNC